MIIKPFRTETGTYYNLISDTTSSLEDFRCQVKEFIEKTLEETAYFFISDNSPKLNSVLAKMGYYRAPMHYHTRRGAFIIRKDEHEDVSNWFDFSWGEYFVKMRDDLYELPTLEIFKRKLNHSLKITPIINNQGYLCFDCTDPFFLEIPYIVSRAVNDRPFHVIVTREFVGHLNDYLFSTGRAIKNFTNKLPEVLEVFSTDYDEFSLAPVDKRIYPKYNNKLSPSIF